MSVNPVVLVVDDDRDLLRLLEIRLQAEGYRVSTAASGTDALKILGRVQPAAVVTDLKMQGLNGIELLTEVQARYPVMPVILMTAHGTIPDAIEATSRGAFAFLTKPIDNQELSDRLQAAIETHASIAGDGEAGEGEDETWCDGIVTRSPAMGAVLREAKLAAASEVSVLLQGESGTGKELLARAIHRASPRTGRPFVTVNCSAIPESLFESEVFGHRKGAFTGAYRDQKGLFRQADEGTLFLDEVGDLPLSSQVKLLRALQDQSIRPVGSERDLGVDVRIIAATHHDLERGVENRTFREDLFYRLNVIKLELPPLKKRREDIPLLADYFLERYGDQGSARRFSVEALQCLVSASWPGNVRQLANVVQQCIVLCQSRLIPLSLVERAMSGKTERLTPFATAREQFEFDYLSRLLKTTGGNVSQAARMAERNRSEFYKLLKKHKIDPAKYRQVRNKND